MNVNLSKELRIIILSIFLSLNLLGQNKNKVLSVPEFCHLSENEIISFYTKNDKEKKVYQRTQIRDFAETTFYVKILKRNSSQQTVLKEEYFKSGDKKWIKVLHTENNPEFEFIIESEFISKRDTFRTYNYDTYEIEENLIIEYMQITPENSK